MMKKFILEPVIFSLVLTTGCLQSTALEMSYESALVSNISFQSCEDPVLRTCKCDELCSFYGDCCKDYHQYEQGVLRNHSKQSFNLDHFECRLMSGYVDYDNLASNCDEPESYWMISKCPETTSKALKRKCEQEHAPDELVQVRYIAPVNDKLGNVYKNYFCAECHNIPPVEIMEWSAIEICPSCPRELSLSHDDFTSMDNGDCRVLVKKPNIFYIHLRTCYKDIIRSCPMGSNATDRQKCSQFSSPGYFGSTFFKNVFCARCYGLKSSLNWSQEVLTTKRCVPGLTGGGFVFNSISFSESLCSLIRCSEQFNLCSGETGRSALLYLSLTINDNFRCLHLKERAELCFFLLWQLVENTISPWKTMIGQNPLWSGNVKESPSVIVYQLPQSNATDWRIQFDQDLLKTARLLIQIQNSCFLQNIELVEVCSDQEWEILGECNEDVVETHGDEILERENNFLNELSFNLSNSLVPSWYSVHTSFKLDPKSTVEKRTLVCFEHPKVEETAIWQSVFSGLCIAITVLFHLATFMTYASFKSLRNTFGISLMCFVMSLAIALCLLEFVSYYIKHIRYLCETVAIVSHYFWLASFCWVTVLAWDLNVTLSPSKMRVRQARSTKRLFAYCCFGWGVPSIVIAVCVTLWVIDLPRFPVTYGSIGGTPCWIYDYQIKLIAVAGPLIGCIVANIWLSLMIWRNLHNYKKDTRVTQSNLHNPKRRMLELVVYVKVSMLMGFSWIFGFLADFTKVEALIWFFYLSYLIQACLIFVFFGLSDRVRNMWKDSRITRSTGTFTTVTSTRQLSR